MYPLLSSRSGGSNPIGDEPSRIYIVTAAPSADRVNSGLGERIRTSDPLYPKQVRYQTAPHQDVFLPTRLVFKVPFTVPCTIIKLFCYQCLFNLINGINGGIK